MQHALENEPLTCQRSKFDLPEDICWLNSAYVAPMLHSVKLAGQTGIANQARPWQITSADFFTNAERIRTLFAGLINADADGIALVPSVSYAAAIAARNLPIQSGQNIVTVFEQFPSNVYAWHEIAREREAVVRQVKFTGDDWTQNIVDAIDSQTAVVSIPNIHWTTGVEFDLLRISERARQAGAALFVDATQSLGALPLDVKTVQPDFLVSTGYKCMLGPYGISYLYVAPKWHGGRPLEEGWLNRANSRDFSRLAKYCDEYQPGARRFDFGERANAILLPMSIAALEQLTQWRVCRIENYTRPLINEIVRRAADMGLTHPHSRQCSSCMVGIGLPEGANSDIAKELAQRGVHVSIRGQNARVATHVYNSSDDVDRFFEAIETVSRL